METDCYKILGIPSDADDDAIKKAFRKRSIELHPDTNSSKFAAEEFIQLKAAQDILLDSTKRLQHDRAFGYYAQPKNKHENAKQKFSEYQTTKAEDLVNAWSNDYGVAMEMREEQRQRAIEKAQRKMRVLKFVMILMSGLILVTAILFFFYTR